MDLGREACELNDNDSLHHLVDWNGQHEDNDCRGIIATLKKNGCLRVQFEESKETVIELPEEMCYLNDKEGMR